MIQEKQHLAYMAATKNTLIAMWGKTSQPKAKEISSDQVSVHSTRNRAAEERSAPEREATSRLAKPDNAREITGKEAGVLKEIVCQASQQVLVSPYVCVCL